MEKEMRTIGSRRVKAELERASQMKLLSFGRGNAKLDSRIATFSLPAGHSCPGALQCLAKVDRTSGKLTDGSEAQFRCFAASAEAVWSTARRSRWANFDALRGKTRAQMAELISASLPDANLIRVHVSGDFFSEAYFLAWMDVARANPSRVFYAYTKSVNVWIANRESVPANFRLVASYGGKHDALIGTLKSARVVFSEKALLAMHLQADHDDSHAYSESSDSFALLVHGQQKAGSEAQAAVKALDGKGSYSRK